MVKWFVLAESSEKATKLVAKISGTDLVSGDEVCVVGESCLLLPTVPFTDWFNEFATKIAKVSAGDFGPGLGVGVLVDDANITRLSPAKDGFDGLVGMLILAFPEVLWRFTWENTPINNEQAIIKARYDWQANETNRLDGWSDGQALREYVRGRVRAELKERASSLRARPKLAVAVDDEPDFALFHAYTAYLHGFQASAVWSNAGMRYFFGESEVDTAKLSKVDLVFEDLALEFPDRTTPVPDTRYSKNYSTAKGNCRETEYPGLDPEKMGRCIFVSYDTSILHGLPSNCSSVDKPCQGIYDLSEKIGLSETYNISSQGNLNSQEVHGDHFHSAPGRLAEVARHILARADRILTRGPKGMQEAILAASLALDAGELIGDKVPTIALESLRIRHAAEVFAECRFSGIQYNLSVPKRLEEIKQKVKLACRGFKPSNWKKAAKNGEMMVLLDLVRILRVHGQFDEVILCQNQIRKLHNGLKILAHPCSLMRFVYFYTEFVFSSPLKFLLGFAGWMTAFAAVFWKLQLIMPEKSALSTKDIGFLEQTFTSMTGANFFSSTAPFLTEAGFLWNLFTVLAVLVGLAHLGLLISLLYMYASRKD